MGFLCGIVTPMSYRDGLNQRQIEAAEHTEGPLLIIAGAGAGKTKTITHRIAHLIEQGVPGDSILAVTFTNKAAREMRERVEYLLSQTPLVRTGGMPLVTTFHSLSVRLIREFAPLLGIPRNFSIWDRDESMKAIKQTLAELDLGDGYEPRAILSRISKEKGRGKGPDSLAHAPVPFLRDVASVWRIYESRLAKDHALDFDDLLLRALTLLATNADVRTTLQNRWRYLTIDEYQDTNQVQFEMARLLAGPNQNLCVVGDVDQNIYSWRGADIAHLLSFEKVFPGAHTVVLEQNYRSTQTILAAAHDIISKNTNRYEKQLFTENGDGEKISLYCAVSEGDEARHVAETARTLLREGTPAHEIAVLYRANFQSRALEQAFYERGIPYRVLGTRFFDRKEVKDVLSYVRAGLNPESRADISRIIATPPRGIGKGTLVHLLEGTWHTLPKGTKHKVEEFYALLESIQQRAHCMSASETLRFVIETSGIASQFLKGTEEDAERLGNIKELVSLAARYDTFAPPEGLEQLLEDAALLGEQDNRDETKDEVSLLTMHASKGLEFDAVFITGLEDGLFPMERTGAEDDPEEERRLMYVALTRARRQVFLSYAATRLVFGTRSITTPSPFLDDIDPAYLELEAPSLLEAWPGERSILF